MAGRKQKPYETSWREIVPGLNRQVDGRWRIVSTGSRFSEPNEQKAVAKAKHLLGLDQPVTPIKIAAPHDDHATYGTGTGIEHPDDGRYCPQSALERINDTLHVTQLVSPAVLYT